LAKIDTVNRTVQVHRLIQALLRDELSVEDRDRFRHEVHLLLAGAAPVDPDDESQWPRYAELVPHVHPARVAKSQDSAVRKFALDVVRYLYQSGEHDEQSLRRHQEVFGDTHPLTLRVMHSLALDYGLISRYQDARDLDQRTYLQRSELTTGVSKADVLLSWNGLARAVRLCGEYAGARDFGQDAYEYGRTELGAEHPRTLWAAKDLSIALRRVGAYDEALELAREVHERCERLFGKDNPDALAAAMSLSNILRTVAAADEGFAIAEEALGRYGTVYGDEHPYYHGCAGNLALLRRERNDAAGARELDEASLAGLDARLGRDHHYPLTVATNLASDLAVLGDAHAARELGEDTLRRLRDLLGDDHPMTLGCAANLSIDLRKDGAEAEADVLAEDTLDRYYRTLGPDHPDVKVAQLGQRLDFDFDPPPI